MTCKTTSVCKTGGGAPRKRRRGAGDGAAFSATTNAALGYATSRYGNAALNMMPHGFNTLADGQGKAPVDNRRVLLLTGATIFSVITKNKRIRRFAPFLGFLTGAAIKQHRLTYQGYGDLNMVESF